MLTFNHPPLDQVSDNEAIARVAYQLIARHYKKCPQAYQEPLQGLSTLQQDLRAAHLGDYAFWVSAYWFRLIAGDALIVAREGMIDRARKGYHWRKVAYPDYKVNRRLH